MQRRQRILFLLFGVLAAVLFVVDLSVGAVPIPIREVLAALTGSGNDPVTTKIILNIRLLKAVVALLAGAALAVSGLQMQTLFRNPLAGPYVLGISSGASLGVAIFLLGAPLLGLTGHPLISTLGIAGAAWIGSALILMLIAAVSRRIKDIMVILILGMMFSSGVGAVVQILQYLSNEAALKSFVVWTMGSLGDVTLGQLGLLLPAVVLGLVLAVAVIIGAARGAGLLLAAVVIIGAAQAMQGAGGAASSGRPPTSSAARAKRKSPGLRRRLCACRSGLVSSVLVCC